MQVCIRQLTRQLGLNASHIILRLYNILQAAWASYLQPRCERMSHGCHLRSRDNPCRTRQHVLHDYNTKLFTHTERMCALNAEILARVRLCSIVARHVACSLTNEACRGCAYAEINRTADFKIIFAIQIGGLYEAYIIWKFAVKAYHICWEQLPIFHAQNLPHPHVTPRNVTCAACMAYYRVSSKVNGQALQALCKRAT